MPDNLQQSLDTSFDAETKRRPRTVLWVAIALVLAWLAIGGVGGQDVGRLSQVQKNDNASFLPESSEATEVAEIARTFADSATLPFLLVVQGPEGTTTLTPQQLGAIQAWAAALPERATPALGAGTTIADLLGEGAPIVAIPSQDGLAALVVLSPDQAKATATVGSTNGVKEVAAAVRSAASDLPDGFTVRVGGPGGLIADFAKAFAGIDGLLLGVALAVVLVILLIVYRSPILPVVVLFSAISGLALAGMAVYPLAKAGHIQLSGQSQGIMFILVVGAATDYALLMVSRFREELHDHPNSWEALKRAWRGTVEPILASGGTVIAGLLCLMLAQLGSTSGLGPVGALGIVGALFSSLTLLPAMLALLGRAAFWPLRPKVDHVHAEDVIGQRGLWGRVARLVGRRPLRTWTATLLALLALAAFLPTFKAEGVATSDIFLTEVDSVEATKAIAAHFPAGSGSPAQIIAPVENADAALAVVKADPGVSSAFLGERAPSPGQPAAPLTVRDGRVLLQATLEDAADSRAAEDTIARLRTSLDAVSPDVLVGGQTATNLDVREASWQDLKLIVPIVLGVIFLVLCLLLRAVIAPLLLIVANVLSFAATLGLAALVFNHVLDFPGADPSIPLYGFVFLIALGIDYSIFLMTRVREESAKRGTRPGVLVGLAVTGGVITSAGIVLAATFSALVVLPLIFLVQTAFIVATGVLIDTFVVRSLLVPALSYDLGPVIWWPRRYAADAHHPIPQLDVLGRTSGDAIPLRGEQTAD